ncbi:hypothetical protein NHX12_033191 [Muraenolepis orangiensis]|uniref:Uncharacterized protein n=1 Tax=Muraenolepis orangiensis TaxID=630683 RepID=A0A9Q0E3E8_9TELE|nr:hypothetical protein NHX12_033191 [Muraenolepis orangiensis]
MGFRVSATGLAMAVGRDLSALHTTVPSIRSAEKQATLQQPRIASPVTALIRSTRGQGLDRPAVLLPSCHERVMDLEFGERRGTIGDIASQQCINARLANAYTAAGADEPSAKCHERRRRAGLGATEYELTLNTPLPGREAVMKSTSNKTQLSCLLCTYDLTADKILLVNHMDRMVKHEEATLISYMLEAARAGAPTL